MISFFQISIQFSSVAEITLEMALIEYSHGIVMPFFDSFERGQSSLQSYESAIVCDDILDGGPWQIQ